MCNLKAGVHPLFNILYMVFSPQRFPSTQRKQVDKNFIKNILFPCVPCLKKQIFPFCLQFTLTQCILKVHYCLGKIQRTQFFRFMSSLAPSKIKKKKNPDFFPPSQVSSILLGQKCYFSLERRDVSYFIQGGHHRALTKGWKAEQGDQTVHLRTSAPPGWGPAFPALVPTPAGSM